jgi:hypothetical protein
MTSLWPWLAIAGLGASHGLSPANGWMFAAACGVRARDAGQARRALFPIAIGHCASIAVVAGAVAQGMWVPGPLFQRVAGVLLAGLATWRLLGGGQRPAIGIEAGPAGIAGWSFLMATAQGTGLMLVPVLAPLCLAANPAREITASGSLLLAVAAVGVHLAAMLATTGFIATGVCRGVASHPRMRVGALARRAWTAALLVTGALLVAIH